jgi:hypothetical protein
MVDVCDPSSKQSNHAHANQTIDMNGAVLMLVSMLLVFTAGTEDPACSVQPRNQRNQKPARSLSIAGVVRFARLCVLIEPNPVRRSVIKALAGFCTFFNAVRRALPSTPPNLIVAASSNSGYGQASLTMLYVLTNFALVVRNPGDPQEGVAVQSCSRSLSTGSRFSLRTGACVRSSPRPAPGR